MKLTNDKNRFLNSGNGDDTYGRMAGRSEAETRSKKSEKAFYQSVHPKAGSF